MRLHNHQLTPTTSRTFRRTCTQFPKCRDPGRLPHSTSRSIFAAAQNPILYRHRIRWQFSRHISTEKKQYYRYQTWLTIRVTATMSGVVLMGLVIFYGLFQEYIERLYPTPREWSYLTRDWLRNGRWIENPGPDGKEIINWVSVGQSYIEVLIRCELPSYEGKGLEDQLKPEGDETFLRFVSKAGIDISSKPYAWRRGYFEALMGCARVAENLDGWKTDKKRRACAHEKSIIGPSNPNPHPVPPGFGEPLREEDVQPTFPAPEEFYDKAMTTVGFSTNERVLIALAYGDYLDYKKRHSAAGAVFRKAVDIAVSASAANAAPSTSSSSIVDPKSGTLNLRARSSPPTPNILLATTALATHHARTGKYSAALPIFLSILRARRSLSAPPRPPARQVQREPSLAGKIFRAVVVPPSYPAPLPSGDEAALRTPAAICEEAGVMANIGELLFASNTSSSQSQKGLAWTRDAVDLAEDQLADLAISVADADPDADALASQKCSECLEMGVANWRKMVRRLATSSVGDEDEEPRSIWAMWAPSSEDTTKRAERRRRKWQAEVEFVEERVASVEHLLARERERRSTLYGGPSWGRFIYGK
ncbi:MAG: hypothetical protein M1825_004819 [Sarcosagium campestre]|nr:MAG: hypothetical protein M1825_004819 [Sarcosagium campestre]